MSVIHLGNNLKMVFWWSMPLMRNQFFEYLTA